MFNLSRFVVPKDFRGRNVFVVQCWWVVQSSLFRWSPHAMNQFRVFLLRMFGANIGKGVVIRPSVIITYPWKVSIGDYSWVGDDAILYSLGDIIIGSNTVVSQKCYLCTGSHDYCKSEFDILSLPITIGNGCWLATDVFVSPGITIQDNVVVGARSTVLSDLQKDKVYAGYPAKYIKSRFE